MGFLEQKLNLRLSQRLVMTPSLQQAIKLLQMSKLELVDEVRQELEENPVLEESQLEPPQEQADSASSDDERNPFDEIDYEAYFADAEASAPPRSLREVGQELPSFESTLTKSTDLPTHLIWQLDLSTSEDTTKAAGRAIIGNINEDGYLKASLQEIQQLGDFSPEEVDQTLKLIQSFDPVGVGARDLTECLLIQLRDLGEEDTQAVEIVRSHMDKLESRRYKELAATLDIEMDDLEAELGIIRGLDPRPGQRYNTQSSNYVVPDVYVVKVDDSYQIMLNEVGLPKLRVSSVYRKMISKGDGAGTSAEAKEYVRGKLRSAFRLIKSIEERQRTIYKVAQSIVKFQRTFLDSGIEKLRPLVLRDVADDIGMHESTVSRVVNNKYMHTHRGLFEMRFFFHSGISSTRGGENVSSLTVKEHIRKIIVAEDSRRPLSDSAIVKILENQSLKIARRTVAKYREELKIPSSNNRKQVFG
jgi:RNA polymerase sigma-54 factor